MKKIVLTIVSVGVSVASFAQVSWPVVTQQAKPWARWWWEGSAVNKPDLTTNLEKYKDAGLGGLEITPIYGIKGQESKFIKYLSPQWVDMLNHTLQEAKRLDIGIDMANATGWPFGGPWVTDETSAKNMEYQTYELKGGESLKDVIGMMQKPMVTSEVKAPPIADVRDPITDNKDLQAMALGQVRFAKNMPLQVLMAYNIDGQAINLTSKVTNGKLDWVAPKGNWTLYAVFMGWHGKMVERAAPGGEGFVIDHYSKPALDSYLTHFDQAFKGKYTGGIRSFFNDSYEVDDARGQATFTPELFAEFKARRGYDLRDHLPELLSKDHKDNDNRVLCDYRETVADMLLDNFTKPWHDWAKAKGSLIRNQSHGSPANILDLYSAVDIPETEGNEPIRFKFATSASHVSGKNLTSSESATWLDDHFKSSLGDVKRSIDKYFLGGVNHVFYHGIAYSPPSAPWPGWLFYASVHLTPADPQWKDFHALNEYIARCQSFLQAGKADNDVLMYYPLFDSFSSFGRSMLKHYDGMRPEFTGTGFEACALKMFDKGYAFDFISDRQIENLVLNGSQLQTGGLNYKTLALPDCHYMPLNTFSKLIKLAQDGAQIIVYKNIQLDVPGLGNLDANRKKLKDLLAQLTFTDAGSGVKKATIGKGVFLMGDDLESLLTYAKIRRETIAENGLQYTRRKYDGGNYYFIVNNGTAKFDGWAPLAGEAASVALFSPMNAVSGLAQTKKAPQGNTEVYLQLLPGESCILQTSAAALKGERYAYTKASAKTIDIKGEWAVTFIDGGPELPPAVKQKDLTSWTEFGGEEVKRFSGTAKYTISFAKPADNGQAWQLNLGKVYQTADVYLNGNKLATLIGPDYLITIPASALKATNQLEVRVSNLMANRISDMDRRKQPYRIFYNINFPAHSRDSRGEDGLFNAALWAPMPSGLVGPVSLQAVEDLKF